MQFSSELLCPMRAQLGKESEQIGSTSQEGEDVERLEGGREKQDCVWGRV